MMILHIALLITLNSFAYFEIMLFLLLLITNLIKEFEIFEYLKILEDIYQI